MKKWRVEGFPGHLYKWMAFHPTGGTFLFREWGSAMLFAMTEADKARDLEALRRLHFRTVIHNG